MPDSLFTSRNPFTGEPLGSFQTLDERQTSAAVGAAHAAQRQWREEPLASRIAVIDALAGVLEARAEELALSLALEMGKPITQGQAEVAKSASLCRLYAASAECALAPTPLDVPDSRTLVHLDPLGLVLGVMPWNYPIWQTLRFAVPSLLLGNGILLKPAPAVAGTTLALEAAARAAGLPEHLFTPLLITEAETLRRIRDDDRVAAVTLTGSAAAGRAVAAAAGAGLKKSVLELGGSDPFIVLADVDVEAAAKAAVASRTQNAGQSCIAAKRFLVHQAVAGSFLDALTAAMAAMTVQDPRSSATELGPLATTVARDRLAGQVQDSIAAGARLQTGANRSEGPDSAFAPVVLTEVASTAPAWTEETFGPVAAVRVVSDADEAIAAANDSNFGLGASLWTSDLGLAKRLTARLETGMVTVNDMVRSDPRVPFGGVKQSGYGRELGAPSWCEFANVKAVQFPGR